MFTCRNILRNAYDVDYFSYLMVFHKSTKCNSKISVTQALNTENKYLFGKLIETQKQRRRNILRKKKDEETVLTACTSQLAALPIEQKINSKSAAAKKTRNVKKSKKVIENEDLKEVEAKTYSCSGTSSNSLSETVNTYKTNSDDLSNNNVDRLSENSENNISSLVKVVATTKLKTKKHIQVAGISESPKSENNLYDFPLENSAKDHNFSEPIGEISRITLDDPEVKSKFTNFPSVSKIISATMSDGSLAALKRWRTKMISQLGEEGFQVHYKGPSYRFSKSFCPFFHFKQRKRKCLRFNELVKAQLNRGSEFHETIRKKLMGETIPSNTEAVSASMTSLQWVFPLLSSTVAVETHTAHPRLRYRGVIDCVAKFKDTPVVIEWKLSDKPKPQLQDTYDAPVQLSAYVGAFNYDNNFKFQINHGLVVVAYSSGSPADAFFLAPKHCEAYWKIWLARLNKFNNMERLHTEHELPTLL